MEMMLSVVMLAPALPALKPPIVVLNVILPPLPPAPPLVLGVPGLLAAAGAPNCPIADTAPSSVTPTPLTVTLPAEAPVMRLRVFALVSIAVPPVPINTLPELASVKLPPVVVRLPVVTLPSVDILRPPPPVVTVATSMGPAVDLPALNVPVGVP